MHFEIQIHDVIILLNPININKANIKDIYFNTLAILAKLPVILKFKKYIKLGKENFLKLNVSSLGHVTTCFSHLMGFFFRLKIRYKTPKVTLFSERVLRLPRNVKRLRLYSL